MISNSLNDASDCVAYYVSALTSGDFSGDQAIKGVRWMPRWQKAMKDVVSCDKLRLAANRPLSEDFRMGQPAWDIPCTARSEPGELKHLSTRRKRKQQ